MIKQTSLKRVLLTRAQTALIVGLFVVLLSGILSGLMTSVVPAKFGGIQKVSASTNGTMNFQARLLTSTGAVVPDGNYHMEFKLYTASSGGVAVWTETRTTGNLVTVVNGYFSVNLGSVTAFGGGINWDQDLYITMNIGGSGGAASWDGEMTNAGTRMKLTGVPYAFRAGVLAKLTGANTSTLDFATQTAARSILLPDEGGTLCIQSSTNCGFASSSGSGSYIQNGTSLQTTANFNIQSAAAGSVGGIIRAATSQTADLQQWQDPTGVVLAQVTSGGGFTLTSSAQSLTVGTTNAYGAKSSINTVSNGNIGLVIRAAGTGQTADLLQLQNSSAANVLTVGHGTQPVSVAGAGTAGGTILGVTGNKGGNTSGTTGQTAGAGSLINLTAGAGGDAPAGSTNGNGGSITLQGGAPGSGLGTAGSYGNLLLQPSGGNVGVGITPSAGETLHVYAVGNSSVVFDSAASSSVILNRGGTGNYGSFRLNTGGITQWAFGLQNNATNNFFIGSGSVAYDTGTAPKLVITPGGNVGVGTSTIGTNNRLIVNAYSTVDNLATAQINTNAATNKGLVVQGFASQSANLQQWQDSSGTVLSYFDSGGSLRVGAGGSAVAAFGSIAPTAGRDVSIRTSVASNIGLVVAGNTSQSANLQQWQDSTGAVLASVTSAGNFTGGTYNGQTISSAASFTGTLAVAGTVTGGTYNGQTISSAANFTGSVVVNGGLRTNGGVAGSTQGTYFGWNNSTGGLGETDFYNNRGGGFGGFNFYNTTTGAGTLLTTIDSAGKLTTGSISTSTGSVYAAGGLAQAGGTVATTGNACYTNAFGVDAFGQCASLRALKHNIQSITDDSMSQIMALQPVTYNWNNDGHADLGFIAEDAAAVNPIFGEYGGKNGALSSVNYTHMVALAIKGIQLQQGQLKVVTDTSTTQAWSIAGLTSNLTTVQTQLGTMRALTNNDFTSLNVSGVSTLASLTVTGNATVGGNLTVNGDTTVANLFVGGKLVARGAKPTTTIGAALIPADNANATATVTGNDTAGTITINTSQAQVLGANSQMHPEQFTTGVVAEVTFSSPYGQMPRVMLTPVNQDSVGAPFYIEKTQTGFKVVFTQTPGANKTYSFDYFVIGSESTN
jgi:fibronectin-binding autotransporter adhesin